MSNIENNQEKGDSATVAEFCLSGITTTVVKFLVFPLENVRNFQICQQELIQQGKLSKPFPSALSVITWTVAEQGALALFRGCFVKYSSYFPTQTLSFVLKNLLVKVCSPEGIAQPWRNLFANFVAGGLSSFLTSVITHPIELIHLQLSLDMNYNADHPRQFNGTMAVLKNAVQKDGFFGLYQGFGVSVCNMFLFRALYLGLYDTLKPYFANFLQYKPQLTNWIFGMGVSALSTLAVFPLIVIRQRMMIKVGLDLQYDSAFHCASSIISNEGIFALYAGLGTHLTKTVITTGLMIIFDEIKKISLN